MRFRRNATLASLTLIALVAVSGAARADWIEELFAPSAELWDRWTAHDPADTRTIDHSAWNRFLAAHVTQGADGINRVAYAKVTPGERAALDGYVARLTGTPISGYGRAAQFAYWINLYNALTVQLVLEHHPVESIRDIDISPGWFSVGPWDKELITVEGEALTLNDIEHRILRPIWRDPRIHYAVNCASLGCPNLLTQAFTGANAETLLDEAARAYINHPRGVRIDSGTLIVSSIYAWFREDFGDNDAGVLAHLERYAEPPLRDRLDGFTQIDDDAYDWALNDIAAPTD